MSSNKTTKEEQGNSIGASLFSNETENDGMASFAEQFKDKVRAIHERFDKNKDGFLNYDELSSLQLNTSGETMSEEIYVMVCRGLDCRPDKGLSLEGLRLTYASDGADLENDYEKVFGVNNEKNSGKEDEDDVFEVGDHGGVDISPDS
mmetsp:Transcript_5140/g.6641  ORF Transcript_5140/g.6641 Transcript_5140/m.6641 type:complete len:148 (+) Transcript_5140:67-510(+)